VSLAFWFLVKTIMGLRVSKTEELEGLDIGEHGEVAYIIKGPRAPELEQLAS
jgi:Amt family ammonium transporter